MAAALPATLPASMRLDVIADPQLRLLLEEDRALRERQNTTREALRNVARARDKCLAAHLPKLGSFKAEITATIDALSAKKDALFLELDKLKLLQSELSDVRQELQSVEYECSTLNKEIRDTELVLQNEMRELVRLRDDRTARAGRLRFATLEQADKELRRIDRELAKCKDATVGGGIALSSRRAAAERDRQELQQLLAFDERVAAQERRVEKYRAALEEKTAARRAREEERT
ncbi:hypothetical protein DQ04_13581030, partial [Trypanosoma grayi]|uniref:hypothetical protein n=1 Tax=Trypanosoma grayi TaxID=71804 RepID=UPI0004F3FE96